MARATATAVVAPHRAVAMARATATAVVPRHRAVAMAATAMAVRRATMEALISGGSFSSVCGNDAFGD